MTNLQIYKKIDKRLKGSGVCFIGYDNFAVRLVKDTIKAFPMVKNHKRKILKHITHAVENELNQQYSDSSELVCAVIYNTVLELHPKIN